ncbi:MAG: hypothetical protein LUD27_03625 [Clostridia bacterium]|nr:hypothetical protein [Clostridia bacterium]
MKFKKLLAALFAVAAMFCVSALSACDNSVAGKTYSYSYSAVNVSEYEGDSSHYPTDERLAQYEEKFSSLYFAFNEDDTFEACYLGGLSQTPYVLEGWYREGSDEEGDYVKVYDSENFYNIDFGSYRLYKEGSSLRMPYGYYSSSDGTIYIEVYFKA